jgi:hypothetical protein
MSDDIEGLLAAWKQGIERDLPEDVRDPAYLFWPAAIFGHQYKCITYGAWLAKRGRVVGVE